MESNIITSVFLPIAIAIIMLGMGLSLVPADFKRVLLYPKAMTVGLIGQLVILPIVGFMVASIFPLRPEMAVGIMILALCPGGPTSNLITYLSRGDVALSVTLTAVSNLLTVFSIPFLVNFSLQHFMGTGQTIQLPVLQTIIQIAILTIIPVALGMLINARWPTFAANADTPVKIASSFLLVLVILAAIIRERNTIVGFFIEVGPAVLVHNVIGMALGFGLAWLARLTWPQQIAIPIEVGIQNGTLAIAIASAPFMLNNPDMAVPPAIYSLIMFATGGLFGFFVNKRLGRRMCACCRDTFQLDFFDVYRQREMAASGD